MKEKFDHLNKVDSDEIISKGIKQLRALQMSLCKSLKTPGRSQQHCAENPEGEKAERLMKL